MMAVRKTKAAKNPVQAPTGALLRSTAEVWGGSKVSITGKTVPKNVSGNMKRQEEWKIIGAHD